MYNEHNIKHFYHIYAHGLWKVPFDEHLRALTDSGLLDVLDFIGVGIVGTEVNRSDVKKVLPYQFQVVAESVVGWEQVTHTAIVKDLQEPSKVLYAHTKGAANHDHDQDTWRREMTDGTIYHWKECIALLDQYDAVGCRWQRHPWRHFSGTFWWATSSYLSTLAPISNAHRDDAEAWIGCSRTGGIHAEINPSYPNLNPLIYPFGRTFTPRKIVPGYSPLEMPDIGQPLLGDEFVGYSPMVGNRIIIYLIVNGATFSMIGDTIIVDSVKEEE